jgi:hypothetical protein
MTARRESPTTTGLATAQALGTLAEYLQAMTDLTLKTGWHVPQMVVAAGEGEEELVVGIRWIAVGDGGGYYAAEIR